MGEQERWTPPERLFWRDATQPQLPPEGVMPGTPAAVPPVPPAPAPVPPASGGFWIPPAPSAPPAKP